jgi:DNA-binding XRE family transcriptional regulator
MEAGTHSPSVALALAIGRELGEPVEALFGGER